MICALNAIDVTAQSPLRFEVASIRLNKSGTTTMKFSVPPDGKFRATNFPLKGLISFGYGVPGSQVAGAPDWTSSDRFDVEARAAGPNVTRDEYQRMVRSLLEERFGLRTHAETRALPSYELVLAKNGSRLKPADPNACEPPGGAGVTCGAFYTGPSSLDGRSMSMAAFSNALSLTLGRPVTDHTGISGQFDIHLEFDPDGANLGNGAAGLSTDGNKSDSERPSIFSALQQQLGLKLESHKEPVTVIVIDRLERLPTSN
jgi:uncharacterized protein (TIGR03435 family)